ncbi:VWA domain-containing protein [Nocardiaceae bacterium YC2-7]|uniref:VWA domain-containing protein n=1 Tax=Antrihabitans stalactiti TaxID=2584121 RepID=A0A848KE75_9NOCA|nr:VWA domain-containing protein [Antrihabitans stalactiti]
MSVRAFGALLVVAAVATGCARTVVGDPHAESDCDATTVLLVDVSLSMLAKDVSPTRLDAAQQAAKAFADDLPASANLGVVAFAGTASVLVKPTIDRTAVKSALDGLRLGERTATGEGIFTALAALESFASKVPNRIVLLSDGKQTVPDSLDDSRGAYTAAREAQQRGVSISTISLGTTGGTVDIPGSSPGSTEAIAVPVDDPSLREIANLAGGSFHAAPSADTLTEAFDSLTCGT